MGIGVVDPLTIGRANAIFLFEYELAFYPNIRGRSDYTMGFNQIPVVESDRIQH